VTEVSKYRVFRENLPTVKIPRLRALGFITAEMTEAVVSFDNGVELIVGLHHIRFPNGGSWSFALCPACGQKARCLRLLFGQPLCTRCLNRHGVRGRLEPMSVRQRAAVRAPELKARLSPSYSRGVVFEAGERGVRSDLA
jgi:hypothetical protein